MIVISGAEVARRLDYPRAIALVREAMIALSQGRTRQLLRAILDRHPGFAEAQYRCREILDRAAAGKLPQNDWRAPHHAALLIAFVHLDIGRIAEAIELADEAMARLPTDPQTKDAFGWALKRVSHWKTDAGLLARAYAWEGYHRGDPGRAALERAADIMTATLGWSAERRASELAEASSGK